MGGGGALGGILGIYLVYSPFFSGVLRSAKGRKGAQQVYDLCGRGSGADRSGGGGRGGRRQAASAGGGRRQGPGGRGRGRGAPPRSKMPDCIILEYSVHSMHSMHSGTLTCDMYEPT